MKAYQKINKNTASESSTNKKALQGISIISEDLANIIIGSLMLILMTLGLLINKSFYYITMIPGLYLILSGLMDDCIIRNILNKVIKSKEND